MNINWTDAPEWAQWAAQDADGDWYWYEEEPSAVEDGFQARGMIWAVRPKWRESLQQRPVKVTPGEYAQAVAKDYPELADQLGVKPGWADAPEWADWLAQTHDGVWQWGTGDFNTKGFRPDTLELRAERFKLTSSALDYMAANGGPQPGMKIPVGKALIDSEADDDVGDLVFLCPGILHKTEDVVDLKDGLDSAIGTVKHINTSHTWSSDVLDKAADDGRIYALKNPIHSGGSHTGMHGALDPALAGSPDGVHQIAHVQHRLFLPWRAVTDAEIAAHGADVVLGAGWEVWDYTIPHEIPLSVSEKLALDLLLQRKLQK